MIQLFFGKGAQKKFRLQQPPAPGMQTQFFLFKLQFFHLGCLFRQDARPNRAGRLIVAGLIPPRLPRGGLWGGYGLLELARHQGLFDAGDACVG